MHRESFRLATLDQFVGREMGVSDWILIDQPRIREIVDCTGDHQWIHVDSERATRASPDRSTIAYGFFILAIVGPTSLEVWIRPEGIATAINYGIDRVCFIPPASVDARTRNRIKLLAITPGRTLITTENIIEMEHQEDQPSLQMCSLSRLSE
jgi:acyl dehydratase